jgi:nitroreductase
MGGTPESQRNAMSASETVLSVPAAAAKRRSIRSYAPDALPQADIETILRETSLAPSAWNLQPWRFVVVRDAAVKQKLAAAAYNQKQVTGAPAVIVLYTDMADTLARVDEIIRPGASAEQVAGFRGMIDGAFAKQSGPDREAWGYAQGFIALGYLLLAAESHGYATSPMAGFDPEAVKQVLDLPAHVRVPALVAIGRGAEEGMPHHRHALERIVRHV